MTSHIPDLHPSREFIETPPVKSGRTWLIFGCVGVLAGLGFSAWTLVRPIAPVEPPPEDFPALAAVSRDDDIQHAAERTEEVDDASERAVDDTGEVREIEEAEPAEAPSRGRFYVQIAAYRDPGDAERHATLLSETGLPAQSFIDPAASWHKVRVGPFTARAEAEKTRFQLKGHERRSAYVLPRSNGKYHVQVASFATREEAEPVMQRLVAQGHATKITRVKMGARRWHCVRVGPFDTAEEAEGYKPLVDGVPGSEATVIPFGPPKPKNAIAARQQ